MCDWGQITLAWRRSTFIFLSCKNLMLHDLRNLESFSFVVLSSLNSPPMPTSRRKGRRTEEHIHSIKDTTGSWICHFHFGLFDKHLLCVTILPQGRLIFILRDPYSITYENDIGDNTHVHQKGTGASTQGSTMKLSEGVRNSSINSLRRISGMGGGKHIREEHDTIYLRRGRCIHIHLLLRRNWKMNHTIQKLAFYKRRNGTGWKRRGWSRLFWKDCMLVWNLVNTSHNYTRKLKANS